MSRAVTRTRAAPDVAAERVDIIAARMRFGAWVRGKTGKELAKEWDVPLTTVEHLSAEAWRRVCAEANDADKVRPTIAGTLAVALAQSAEAQSHKTTAQLADTWSRVVGARAAERHEVAVVVAQYDALPRAGKIAALEARVVQLQAEIARLKADESGG